MILDAIKLTVRTNQDTGLVLSEKEVCHYTQGPMVEKKVTLKFSGKVDAGERNSEAAGTPAQLQICRELELQSLADYLKELGLGFIHSFVCLHMRQSLTVQLWLV